MKYCYSDAEPEIHPCTRKLNSLLSTWKRTSSRRGRWRRDPKETLIDLYSDLSHESVFPSYASLTPPLPPCWAWYVDVAEHVQVWLPKYVHVCRNNRVPGQKRRETKRMACVLRTLGLTNTSEYRSIKVFLGSLRHLSQRDDIVFHMDSRVLVL